MPGCNVRSCEEYEVKDTCIDSFLCGGLLHDTDEGIGYENEEDDDGLDECACKTGVLVVLEEGEDERNDGRGKENEDELVLELLEDQFP